MSLGPDNFPTPDSPRPGTAAMAASHTIEISIGDAAGIGDFLERLAFILRMRRSVRITIE